MAELRTCTQCSKTLPLSCFYKVKANKSGRDWKCGPCRREIVYANRRAKTPEYRNRLKRRNILKKRFGISEEIYNDMFAAQKGLCAVCRKPETGRSGVKRSLRMLAVDHCHDSGKVRALLCHSCNAGLGHFKDSPALLNEAAEYLKQHGRS